MSSVIEPDESKSVVSNGTEKVVLGDQAFTHCVLGAPGITFHWKADRVDARAALAKIFAKVETADKDHIAHQYFHTTEADDAKFSELHAHFLLDWEKKEDRARAIAGIKQLVEEKLLTEGEAENLIKAIIKF